MNNEIPFNTLLKINADSPSLDEDEDDEDYQESEDLKELDHKTMIERINQQIINQNKK